MLKNEIFNMPNSNFNIFVANYWSSIDCKKIYFCVPKTVFNYFILKTLLADGYIRSFKAVENKFWITSIDLSTTIKFNKIVKYSGQKRPIYINFRQLLDLTKTGGYFILSTSLGIMNDSDARFHKLGGTLLLGIF